MREGAEKRAQPINSAEDDDDDDFIAFEGPTLNLAPPREIEPGGEVYDYYELQPAAEQGRPEGGAGEVKTKPQRSFSFVLSAPQARRPPLISGRGCLSLGSKRGGNRWRPSSALDSPFARIRMQNALARQETSCDENTHRERGREGGRTGEEEREEEEEEGERLAAHPRHDRRFVTLLL